MSEQKNEQKNGKTKGIFVSGRVEKIKPTKNGNIQIFLSTGDMVVKFMVPTQHGWELDKHYDLIPINPFGLKDGFIGGLEV